MSRSLVLAAGAGTGKTHALVGLALELYAGAGGDPVDPARVWAVTFTEKAAAELQGRILARVRALAAGGSEPGVPDLPPGRWEEIARSLQAAPIGNFHSLCARFLRENAGEAGVAPGFDIVEESAAAELFERAREETLLTQLADATGPARRLVRDLGGLDRVRQTVTLLHLRLAEEGRDPLSLVEGPGGVPHRPFDPDPHTAELVRACSALRFALEGLATTDHPRLAGPREVLDGERDRLGKLEPAKIALWYAAAKAVCESSAGRGAVPREARGPWDAVKTGWEALQDAQAASAQARVGRDLAGLLEHTAAAYEAEKKRAGVLDFSDLVRRVRDLLRDRPDVRRAAKERVGALLVDEFQDTNGVQLDVVHLLGEERSEERAVPVGARCADLPLEPGVLRAVGDRKQSIYEFRGADVSLFAELTAKAERGEGFELRTLHRSRRSLPGIVSFVNEVVGRVLGTGSMSFDVGFRAELDALEAVRDAPPGAGFPDVELLESDPGLSASERRPLEAALVARHVSMLLARQRPLEVEGGTRAMRGGDVALLLRSFTEVETYRRALAERGVPSIVVRGRGFFGAREVRDLSALLLALADPRDPFAAAAVFRSPLVALSDDALVILAEAKQLSLADCSEGIAALPPADARKLSAVAPLLQRLSREVDRLGADGVLELAVQELGYEVVLAASFEGELRLANVRKLIAWVAQRRGAGALALAEELLARADGREDREPPAEAAGSGDAVQVMTIHAAKGLEFPVVVVPELGFTERNESAPVIFDRGLGLAVRVMDPAGGRRLDAHGETVLSELEARRDAESARLLYVATTRARDLLVLCGGGGPKSWRGRIERALEGRAGLVVRIPPPDPGDEEPPAPPPVRAPLRLVPPPSPPAARGRKSRSSAGQLDLFVQPSAPPPAAPEVAPSRVAALQPLRLPPGSFVSAVTELADLAVCERRFFYARIAGLEEHTGRSVELEDDPDEMDRRERGQLAHRLLEHIDLARAARDPAGAVEAVLSRDPARAAGEARGIAGDIRALLESPLGKEILKAPRVWRELPFILEVQGGDGSQLALRGQINLLFVDGTGAVNVVDYKHASATGQPADAYAFQLLTYALAAERVLPPGTGLRAGLAWLRDESHGAALRAVSAADLRDHERALGGAAEQLTRIRDSGAYRKLPRPEECGGCGFRTRCWGSPG